jgi:hypothetical protein
MRRLFPTLVAMTLVFASFGIGLIESYWYLGFWHNHVGIQLEDLFIFLTFLVFGSMWISKNLILWEVTFILHTAVYLVILIITILQPDLVKVVGNDEALYLVYHLDYRVVLLVSQLLKFSVGFLGAVILASKFKSFRYLLINTLSLIKQFLFQLIKLLFQHWQAIKETFTYWSLGLVLLSLHLFLSQKNNYFQINQPRIGLLVGGYVLLGILTNVNKYRLKWLIAAGLISLAFIHLFLLSIFDLRWATLTTVLGGISLLIVLAIYSFSDETNE